MAVWAVLTEVVQIHRGVPEKRQAVSGDGNVRIFVLCVIKCN